MTRVIHTGDTHIGYQQYNRPERRRDFLEAFRSVVDDAIEDDIDAVVHAGDLFHDRRPGLRDLQGTIEILRRLEDAGIPFLAVVGNHESKRDAQWLDLFGDLGLATRLGADPYLLEDVALYGLDFVPRSHRESLEYEFEPVPESVDTAALVSHGLFEPFAHADWDTSRLLAESNVAFDAVLLGDNHAPGTETVDGTWVTYCGSTERASASEREDRGYNLVHFTDASSDETPPEGVDIRRRGIAAGRNFVFVDVELREGEGIDRVRERVREYDLADAVVIVTIEGDGEPITPATVEEFATDRDALVSRVNDRRELPEEDEAVSVQFADPDAAVRERVRELGLSDAATTIDRTVRDGSIPDSNVRERVEREVRDLLETDRSAFESADRDDSEGKPETSSDPDSDTAVDSESIQQEPTTAQPASESAADTSEGNGSKVGDMDHLEPGDTDEPAGGNSDSDDADESAAANVDSDDGDKQTDDDAETTSLGDFA